MPNISKITWICINFLYAFHQDHLQACCSCFSASMISWFAHYSVYCLHLFLSLHHGSMLSFLEPYIINPQTTTKVQLHQRNSVYIIDLVKEFWLGSIVTLCYLLHGMIADCYLFCTYMALNPTSITCSTSHQSRGLK